MSSLTDRGQQRDHRPARNYGLTVRLSETCRCASRLGAPEADSHKGSRRGAVTRFSLGPVLLTRLEFSDKTW
jgi:hypothetical protein